MAVTIYDIAEQAKVSIATVSRVFSESPRVAPATRQRVHEIAESLGYRPHAMAQGLARRTTELVSAVIPVLTNYFYMEVLRGMQGALNESRYDLLVYTAQKPEEVDGQFVRALQRGRSDGLVLVSTPISEERESYIEQGKQPIVLVDAFHPRLDSISVENRYGGYIATRHLIERGCRKIAHITVAPEPPPARERREGYERAMREAGLSVQVVASPRMPIGFCEEAGYESMKLLLEGPERPDGVFIASDIQALGSLIALQEAGISVPEDMALVGYDDIKLSSYVRLTTVRQPMYEMGQTAIQRLLARFDDPDAEPVHLNFRPELIRRASA